MFVARSAGRIRMARTLFVLLGLVPLCGLVGWAVHLRSGRHLEAIRRDWQRAVGLPLVIGRVHHPRLGVVRADDVVASTPGATPVLELGSIELETTPAEWRLRLGRVECDPEGARLLAGLVRDWLERGPRFEADGIIEVADMNWGGMTLAGEDLPRPLRIECVRQKGARAIRICRSAGTMQPPVGAGRVEAVTPVDTAAPADEVRLVRWISAAQGAINADDGGRPEFEVEACWGEPLPVALVAAFADALPLAGWSLGSGATVLGQMRLAVDGTGRSRIDANGRIESIDLAASAASVGLRARGTADMTVSAFAWRDGRLASCDITCDLGPGAVERRFLDTLVTTVGCRPGAGYATAFGSDDARFDAASCRIRIAPGGVVLSSGPRLGGPLAVTDGRPLVEPPVSDVPASRLAWLLAPPDAAYVPSAGPGAWLLSIMPKDGASLDLPQPDPPGGSAVDRGGNGPEKRTSQAGAGGGIREF
jgi:hypothetical protein